MADDVDPLQNLTSHFPHPPPFYKHFTPANLALLQQARDDAASNTSTNPNDVHLRPQDVPPELKYLVPPNAPNDAAAEAIHTFDHQPTTSPPAPTHTTLPQLHTHVRSLLLHYLELLGVLSQDPASFQASMTALQENFTRAHELVNEYRPHQAREAMITLLEGMVKRRKAEVAGVQGMRGRVDEVLGVVGGVGGSGDGEEEVVVDGGGVGDDVVVGSEKKEEEENARRVWNALEAVGT